jgi:glycosyltransferase involved in cell wall biosynthesis
VRGRWPNEAAQRNEGLKLVADAGIDYCVVVDADEIYDESQLNAAMTIVRQNPQIDCWRLTCLTYWKSYRYRVDPPELMTAPVFVRPGTGRFVDNRLYDCERHYSLPADTIVFHHMSYARTDAQVLRKITTFGHARDVVPGWFEQVWQRWDSDHSLENLNPCWPAAYRRIIEQPYDALPKALRRLCDTGIESVPA